MRTIYTMGYAAWMADEMEAEVRRRGAVLVDVRLNPVSRKPGFNKYSLARRLGEAYRHVQAFGNVNHRNDGPVQLKDPAAGLAEVAALLEERDVILLCGCKDPEHCHRTVAARLLAEATGAPVEHLLHEKAEG